jgi:hypothetical protein
MNMKKQNEILPSYLKYFFSNGIRPNVSEEKEDFYKQLKVAMNIENLSLPDKMQVFNEQYFKDYLLLGSEKKDPTVQETNSFTLSNAFLVNDNGKNLLVFLEENNLSLCTNDFSIYSKNEILEVYKNNLF